MYIVVYRIEHNIYHDGPYRGQVSCTPRVRYMGPGKDPHPTPWCENIRIDDDVDVCGFESIEQFKKWFLKDDRKELAKNGFVLRKFKIGHSFVKYGKKQIVFHKGKARKLEELNPAEV